MMVARDSNVASEVTIAGTDRTTFDFADGWDFGDRVAYSCAWVEFYQGQNEEFEVAYHAVGDYPVYLEINDKYGAETESGTRVFADGRTLQNVCLEDSGVRERSDFRFDGGSGHFPHGMDLVFYRDGGEIARIDYDMNTCGHLYWVAGR